MYIIVLSILLELEIFVVNPQNKIKWNSISSNIPGIVLRESFAINLGILETVKQLIMKKFMKCFFFILQNQIHQQIYNVHKVLWISLSKYHGQPLLNPMDSSIGIRLMSVRGIWAKSSPHQMKLLKMLKTYHQVWLKENRQNWIDKDCINQTVKHERFCFQVT